MTRQVSAPDSGRGVALGLVFGAGVGGATAGFAGVSIASAVGFGVGGGIVVGALVERVLVWRDGSDVSLARLVALSAGVGTIMGAVVGVVGAWGLSEPLGSGAVTGVAAGVVHGLLVGGALALEGTASGASSSDAES